MRWHELVERGYFRNINSSDGLDNDLYTTYGAVKKVDQVKDEGTYTLTFTLASEASRTMTFYVRAYLAVRNTTTGEIEYFYSGVLNAKAE